MATEEGRTFFQEEPVCEHLSGMQDSALAKCQWLIFKKSILVCNGNIFISYIQ